MTDIAAPPATVCAAPVPACDGPAVAGHGLTGRGKAPRAEADAGGVLRRVPVVGATSEAALERGATALRPARGEGGGFVVFARDEAPERRLRRLATIEDLPEAEANRVAAPGAACGRAARDPRSSEAAGRPRLYAFFRSDAAGGASLLDHAHGASPVRDRPRRPRPDRATPARHGLTGAAAPLAPTRDPPGRPPGPPADPRAST